LSRRPPRPRRGRSTPRSAGRGVVPAALGRRRRGRQVPPWTTWRCRGPTPACRPDRARAPLAPGGRDAWCGGRRRPPHCTPPGMPQGAPIAIPLAPGPAAAGSVILDRGGRPRRPARAGTAGRSPRSRGVASPPSPRAAPSEPLSDALRSSLSRPNGGRDRRGERRAGRRRCARWLSLRPGAARCAQTAGCAPRWRHARAHERTASHRRRS
jgi:hypothetical protein